MTIEVRVPVDAKAGELVQFDERGRCGLATSDVRAGEMARLLIVGDYGGRSVNYPYRWEGRTYGFWE